MIIPMQAQIFYIIFLVFFTLTPQVQSAEPPAKKSRLNTQIYEKQDSVETFQDQVKLVRDMAGESQVIFKAHPGFYVIEDTGSGAKFKNLLLKAQKNNRQLSITVDTESRLIKEVAEKE
jgi:hypothetical protein